MALIPLDKTYTDAANGMMRQLKSATRETATDATGTAEIIIEGQMDIFALSLMDTWGGHLRFVFRDTEAKSQEDIQARGEIAMLNPALAGLLTSKATLQVYRRQLVTTRTIKIIAGREVSRNDVESEDWTDVTVEFSKLGAREAAFFDR